MDNQKLGDDKLREKYRNCTHDVNIDDYQNNRKI